MQSISDMILLLLMVNLGFILGIVTLLGYMVWRMMRNEGWDDSNMTNAIRLITHVVLHPHDSARAVPPVWIMISPLSVTSLALQSVARDAFLLGGRWTEAVVETAAMLAAMLWGFALWWTAAATLITRHSGRGSLTGTAADWAFVFPPAALVLATLTLGRVWDSTMVELLGVVFAISLLAAWAAVSARSIAAIRADQHRAS